MKRLFRFFSVLFLFSFIFLLAPKIVYAYGGPGSVISGVGAFIAAVAAVIAAIFGFLWFPIKRLFTGSDTEEDTVEKTEKSDE